MNERQFKDRQVGLKSAGRRCLAEVSSNVFLALKSVGLIAEIGRDRLAVRSSERVLHTSSRDEIEQKLSWQTSGIVHVSQMLRLYCGP